MDTLNGSRKARYDYTSYGQLEGDESNPMPSNSFTYTGREEDGTGLLYYRARYYDPELGVFISQDPLGDAQRYVGGNPVGFIDPLGLDAIQIVFQGFDVTVAETPAIKIPPFVNIPPGKVKAPLGHAGVVAIDPKTGMTKYFEYGRYDAENFGIVLNPQIPDVVIGSDGKPTATSLQNLYNHLSKDHGQNRPVQATYYPNADYNKVVQFAKNRMKDPNRKRYGIGNTCYDFAKEAIDAGEK